MEFSEFVGLEALGSGRTIVDRVLSKLLVNGDELLSIGSYRFYMISVKTQVWGTLYFQNVFGLLSDCIWLYFQNVIGYAFAMCLAILAYRGWLYFTNVFGYTFRLCLATVCVNAA